LISPILKTQFIIKDIAVAIAAPRIPRIGINRILRRTFRIAQNALILKGICTFPILASVAPIAINGENMVYPRRRMSKEGKAKRNSLVNKNIIRYCPNIAMNMAIPAVAKRLLFIVEKIIFRTPSIFPCPYSVAVTGAVTL